MVVETPAVQNHRARLVQWELTRACKLSCLHCPIGAQQRRSPLELSTYEAYKTIDQIVALGAGELVITGGDPLERPDIFQLIDYARRRGLNPALAVSATSQLSGAAIGKLRQHGLSRVVVSIDSSAPDRHDALRGTPGQFTSTLLATRWARTAGIALEASTLVTRRNASELGRIADLLHGIGVDRWNVYFLVPIGESRRLPALTADEAEATFQVIEDIASKSSFHIRVFEAPHFRRFLIQRAAAAKQASIDAMFENASDVECERTRNRAFTDRDEVIFISHTGEVSISPFLPMTVGNVRYQPLSYLYGKAEMFLTLRDVANLKGKCGRCEFKSICGGSRARAFAVTGDLFAADPLCNYQPGAFVPAVATMGVGHAEP